MWDETVLFIRTKDIAKFLQPLVAGLIQASDSEINQALSECGIWLGPRSALEKDEAYRQLIPYVVLTAKGRIAVYTRSRFGNEARLHDKLSIGFGGHIGLPDLYRQNGVVDGMQTIRRAAAREVIEEVNCEPAINRRFIGWIWDDSSPVNRVHLGILELWELEDIRIQSNEIEVQDTRFVTLEELSQWLDRLEPWSGHAAKAILEGNLL